MNVNILFSDRSCRSTLGRTENWKRYSPHWPPPSEKAALGCRIIRQARGACRPPSSLTPWRRSHIL